MLKNIGRKVAPPRFLLFCLIFPVAVIGLASTLGIGRAVLAGFDLASAVFLLSLWPLLARGEADRMREQAARNDANRAVLLGVTAATILVVLVAVAGELRGREDAVAVALVIATLALAWLFSNIVYAMHYAHLFYGGDDRPGGLDFPGCAEPDYWDFVYFAVTLGMTFQTSDVQITARHVRRVVLGHTVLAFVFNLGVVAFSINVIGGS